MSQISSWPLPLLTKESGPVSPLFTPKGGLYSRSQPLSGGSSRRTPGPLSDSCKSRWERLSWSWLEFRDRVPRGSCWGKWKRGRDKDYKDPGNIRARVLEGSSLSPRISKTGFSNLTGASQGRGHPSPIPGHRDGKAGLTEWNWDRGRQRHGKRQVDEDPVAVAAFLQPPAWLRWKRWFQLQPPDRLRIS